MKLISSKYAAWAAFAVFVLTELNAYFIYSAQAVKPPMALYVLGMIALGLLLAATIFFSMRVSGDKIWRTLFVAVAVGTVASLLQVLFDGLRGRVDLLSLVGVVPWACGFVGLLVSKNEPFWKNIKPKRKL